MKTPFPMVSRIRYHIHSTYRAAHVAYLRFKHQQDFQQIQYYCMFIGYPRSGHTLVGSLLDAHPHMIIAHELNVLKYLKNHVDQENIFSLLLENSQRFTRAGRKWQGYSYMIPGQWNGRFQRLHVIGDKKGGRSTRMLREQPELLAQLAHTIHIPIKFIHVIRNPYDNISTLSRRHELSLQAAIADYFQLCETITTLRSTIPSDAWLDITHEAVIEDPRTSLKTLCEFLGQGCPAAYADACASIIYTNPHKSREKSSWTPSLRQEVAEKMARYPFLTSYRYED